MKQKIEVLIKVESDRNKNFLIFRIFIPISNFNPGNFEVIYDNTSYRIKCFEDFKNFLKEKIQHEARDTVKVSNESSLIWEGKRITNSNFINIINNTITNQKNLIFDVQFKTNFSNSNKKFSHIRQEESLHRKEQYKTWFVIHLITVTVLVVISFLFAFIFNPTLLLPLILIGIGSLVVLPPVISALVVLAKVGIDLISDVFSYFTQNGSENNTKVISNSYSKTQQDLVQQGKVQTHIIKTEIKKEDNSILDGVRNGLIKLNFFERALDTVCGKLAGYPEFHREDSSLNSL